MARQKDIRTLRELKEGDKFRFLSSDTDWIPLKNRIIARDYFVEGQYPKFHCTTVCAAQNIRPCNPDSIYDASKHMTMVTGVEDRQKVVLIKANAIHICHEVTFN